MVPHGEGGCHRQFFLFVPPAVRPSNVSLFPRLLPPSVSSRRSGSVRECVAVWSRASPDVLLCHRHGDREALSGATNLNRRRSRRAHCAHSRDKFTPADVPAKPITCSDGRAFGGGLPPVLR